MCLVSTVKTSYHNLIYHGAGMVVHILLLKFSTQESNLKADSMKTFVPKRHFITSNTKSYVVIFNHLNEGLINRRFSSTNLHLVVTNYKVMIEVSNV